MRRLDVRGDENEGGDRERTQMRFPWEKHMDGVECWTERNGSAQEAGWLAPTLKPALVH